MLRTKCKIYYRPWMKRFLPFLLFTVFIVLLGRGLTLDPQRLPSMQEGRPLIPFVLPALKQGSFFSSEMIKGKTVLLNVWASWCRACEEEQPFLMQLKKQGIPIYGLNYRDLRSDAQSWLTTWGNPYTDVGLDKKGSVAIDLGVYGTPETFLIDAKGVVLFRYAGVLNQRVWKQCFLPHFNRL